MFQWGWLGAVGVEPGPIEPFIPMMLFAVLFGLSMDYEVFLLSRMKEEFERTGDPVNSVADVWPPLPGSCPALMVFASAGDQRSIKMLSLGLAAAVAECSSCLRNWCSRSPDW